MTKRTSRRVAVQWMAVLAAASFAVGCAQPASLSPTGVPSTSRALDKFANGRRTNRQYADSKHYFH